MKAIGRLVPASLFLLANVPALATDDVGDALRACRAESDDVRRLACYDRLAARTQPPAAAAAAKPVEASAAPEPGASAAPPAPAPTAAAPTAAAAATAAKPEDTFGRERQIAHEEDKRRAEESRAVGEISAVVTRIDTRMDGLMTFTLDNGQVWRQNAPDSRFRLRTGDEVRIQAGSLNSFILSGPSKRSTRVTRVQ